MLNLTLTEGRALWTWITDPRGWAWTLWVVGALCLLQFGHGVLAEPLEFERKAILQGEVYRALTGHFVHVGWVHCLLNMGALLLLSLLFPRALGWRGGLLAIIFCSLFISAGLLLQGGIQWYQGLSGALHGLFVLCALVDRGPRWLRVGCLVSIAAKLLLQANASPDSGTAILIGAPVVDSAHVWGAAAGVALGVAFLVGRTLNPGPSYR